MRVIYIATLLIPFLSCTDQKAISDINQGKGREREVAVPAFQTILDSADVDGAILIYDIKDSTYFSNDYEWAKKGNLPASTFKIPNSIIALEIGIVENDSTLFKWNGEKRLLRSWEQDLIFKEAFHYSCVPCYQEVARKIGAKRMKEYLDKLEYGNITVDSATIDLFWREGESRINQFEQIGFLKRFSQSKLPISQRTEDIMKKMMVIEENAEYKLSGKTGWSTTNGNDNGWFVGYLECKNKMYFFATNLSPKEQFDMALFPMIRKEVTLRAFELMKIIE